MSAEQLKELYETARHLCRPGHGILAADESTGTIGKRLISHNLENTAENRRALREILLCAPGNEAALGGAILFDETFYQKASDGRSFTSILAGKGILPGIKVDTGLKPLEGSPGETYTSGIDTLEERCTVYRQNGARFAKWRAALRIDEARNLPSEEAIQVNADLLAQYAAICIKTNLVPLVEPEILIDGSHEQSVSANAARRVISAVYEALEKHQVPFAATLLKPMMILPGRENEDKQTITAAQVASVTLQVMKEVVPAQVAGIMFLSGGMSEVQATENLNTINKLAKVESAPWQLSFSFGRALQASALEIWAWDQSKSKEASEVAAKIAIANGQAQLGNFQGEHPSQKGGGELYENFRGWRSGEDKKGT